MKSIIIIAILLIGYVTFDEALQCYSHSECSINCPQLSHTIRTCTDNANKCYKVALPGGVTRGCTQEQCNVQINANSVMADVCCERDLCNSAIRSQLKFPIFFMIISAFVLIQI